MSDPGRPVPAQVAIRFALGLLAFVLLWRVPEPALVAVPTTTAIGQAELTALSSLIVQIVAAAAAGAAFALAARPHLGSGSFRWGLPLILATIPAIVIATQVVVLTGAYRIPVDGMFRGAATFLVSTFSLRVPSILLGVALAQAVVPVDEDLVDEERA